MALAELCHSRAEGPVRRGAVCPACWQTPCIALGREHKAALTPSPKRGQAFFRFSRGNL
jgi:hypothetical protein